MASEWTIWLILTEFELVRGLSGYSWRQECFDLVIVINSILNILYTTDLKSPCFDGIKALKLAVISLLILLLSAGSTRQVLHCIQSQQLYALLSSTSMQFSNFHCVLRSVRTVTVVKRVVKNFSIR